MFSADSPRRTVTIPQGLFVEPS